MSNLTIKQNSALPTLDNAIEENMLGSVEQLQANRDVAKSTISSAHQNMNTQFAKRIEALKKYVSQITKGGFFKPLLKTISVALKVLSPLQTVIDTGLNKIFKGKFKILTQALSFAINFAATLPFGGSGAIFQNVTNQLGKYLTTEGLSKTLSKGITDFATKHFGTSFVKGISKIASNKVQFILNIARAANQATQTATDTFTQKAMATHQLAAQKFKLYFKKAEDILDSVKENVQKNITQISRQWQALQSTAKNNEKAKEAINNL